MIEPVIQVSAYELVAEQIRRAIHLGTFAPGDKLPSERELAKQLGVSRVTLREAIRVLETQGYIESRRGSRGGLLVLDQRDTRERLRQRLRQEWGRFQNILDFRVANECAAARRVASQRTEKDLDKLKTTVEDMRVSESLAESRRADSTFHLAIADATNNPLLREAVEKGRTAMFLPADVLSYEVIFGDSVDGHRRILTAIEEFDPHGADDAMEAHIEKTRQELREILLP